MKTSLRTATAVKCLHSRVGPLRTANMAIMPKVDMVSFFRKFSSFAALSAGALGFTVLLVGAVDVVLGKEMTPIVPGLRHCFSFYRRFHCGLWGEVSRVARNPALTRGLAITIAGIGLFSFCAYLLNWNPRRGQLLLRSGISGPAIAAVLRMSPAVAAELFLIAFALALTMISVPRGMSTSICVPRLPRYRRCYS